MITGLTISNATLPDVPALEELVNSAYRGDSSKKGWTTEADFLDGMRIDRPALIEIINSSDSVILKCSDSTQIIGCVYLKRKRNELYLGMLTVSPTIQNRGIGKLLLDASEDYARKRDLNLISITVITLRKELIDWYKRRGFRNTDRTEPFPADPRFGIPKQELKFTIMEKTINDSI